MSDAIEHAFDKLELPCLPCQFSGCDIIPYADLETTLSEVKIALPGGNTRYVLRKFGEPLPRLLLAVII